MSHVVVIGAGAAGLSAAGALAALYDVTIVEEAPSPGGIAASLSCKSDAECGLCAACTVPDLASEAPGWAGARLLTSTRVEGAERLGDGRWRLRLSGAEEGALEADAVVVATGLAVTDGTGTPEYGAGHLDGVVTALELDRALRAVGDGRAGGAETAALPPDGGSMALIQCACSRDVKNLPYCSRVCCAYTARLAMELRRRLPDCAVTVFYMDLQRSDRVASARMDAAVAAEGITYVRSRPASVERASGGRLAVVYEDTATGEPLSREFDRVVLATGIVPSEGTRRVASLLGVGLDADGFIATLGGAPPGTTPVPRVFAAGGATGPVDVVEASAGGMAAAGAAIGELGRAWEGGAPRVLVAGEGRSAQDAADLARAAGATVEAVGPLSALVRLDGEPLAFRATVAEAGGNRRTVDADVVVLAPPPPSTTIGPVPHSEPYDRLLELLAGGARSFAIVMDEGPAAMLAARDALAADARAGIRVLHRDLAVSEPGMQELHLELTSAGVSFHRYAPGSLEVAPNEGAKGLRVALVDESTAPNGHLALVVDAVLAPAAPVKGEAGPGQAVPVARYAPGGVPTPERVGASPVLTSRRGVYTASPATLTSMSASLGGAAAATAALADLARGFPEAGDVASVDEDDCAACLNCLRMCPHDAIVFDETVRAARVLRRACQACGMCRGVCPAQAITLGAAPVGGGASVE